MKINFLSAKRTDINVQLAMLRPAFNRIKEAKEEYQFCCDAVRKKQAGFYSVRGVGVKVRFVGMVTRDNDYLVLALTGKGLVNASQKIIDAVKGQGYRSIIFHTVRPGMTRILKRFGFVESKTNSDSILTLHLGGH